MLWEVKYVSLCVCVCVSVWPIAAAVNAKCQMTICYTGYTYIETSCPGTNSGRTVISNESLIIGYYQPSMNYPVTVH